MTDRQDDVPAELDSAAGEGAFAPGGEIMGHPTGLFFLFFAELWERFSFYGMRALLTLYLATELFKDVADGKTIAYEIYAAYGSLVYFTPALGGMIADRVIGHKNSIMLGALLMTIGHFTMAFESESIFYLSLGLLIIGNGFFKPNISSLVGGLYREGDTRRDGGFTIFYLGINLGAFMAPLACGYLGENYGWHYGFSAAGIGMFIGLLVFWYGRVKGIYGEQGEQPLAYASKNLGGINVRYLVYALSFLSVPLFAMLVSKSELTVFGSTGLLQFLLISLLILVLVYLTYVCVVSDKITRDRLIVVVVLTFFVTVFWAFFEQAGSSLTLFAEEQVRLVGLNASQTNAINPFYIVALAIPFSMMWNKLESKKMNPNTMIKFGLGIGQLGVGFLVFALSARFMDDEGKVGMIFLLVGYLLITSGELFLSPIGLSKVTELSPAKLVAFMMGVWFLSSSFAHYIAGLIAKLTTGGGHGEGEASEAVAEVVAEPSVMASLARWITGASADEAATASAANLLNYTSVFAQIAIISFVVAAIALLISPIIKRMMHGIR
ncbi:Di-/tripeptide transporter [Rubripirellula lacrimiformis]|uniref:Di-/tripeptide transporter n=1 Tax=Rubripirellula lacrimiformis TaxID=1930273 RepID=A0A517NFB2_9BACT|nr:peptide MFS transporter [Rubripirellula lacrimiformis]QDT05795.1 Di-/tripeptide transporter [Rubripirellula lacrimiformis]